METIQKGKVYLENYFNGYEQKIAYPANYANPKTRYRYDYTVMGMLCNVYTRDFSFKEQIVTSIWEVRSRRSLEKLVL